MTRVSAQECHARPGNAGLANCHRSQPNDRIEGNTARTREEQRQRRRQQRKVELPPGSLLSHEGHFHEAPLGDKDCHQHVAGEPGRQDASPQAQDQQYSPQQFPAGRLPKRRSRAGARPSALENRQSLLCPSWSPLYFALAYGFIRDKFQFDEDGCTGLGPPDTCADQPP